MDLQVAQNGTILNIKMFGEIDHHTSEDLREKVDKAYERSGCREMIFDFSQVTFMDSSGIGMIIGRYKNAEKRGGTLSIVGMNPDLNRIFTISGLGKIIKCYATPGEAEKNIS